MFREICCVSLRTTLHRRLAQLARRRRAAGEIKTLPDLTALPFHALGLDGRVLVEQLVAQVGVVLALRVTKLFSPRRRLLITRHLHMIRVVKIVRFF